MCQFKSAIKYQIKQMTPEEYSHLSLTWGGNVKTRVISSDRAKFLLEHDPNVCEDGECEHPDCVRFIDEAIGIAKEEFINGRFE